jgi:hypothetical protein
MQRLARDAELDAALRRKTRVALDHSVLDLDCAPHCIYDASELSEDAIPSTLNDAAVLESNSRVDEVAAERTQSRKRPLLVGTGEPAVSGYIRRKNGREFPGLRHGSPLTTSQTSTIARQLLRLADHCSHRGIRTPSWIFGGWLRSARLKPNET